jgi:hypothetical protein
MRTKIKPRRARHLQDGFISTHRALNDAARQLRLKVLLRTKPAFKRMLLSALKVKNFHNTAFMAQAGPAEP